MALKVVEYLNSMGWSSSRKIKLPTEYSVYLINDKVKNIIENIYGLTFKTKTQERIFYLDKLDFECSNEYLNEINEEYNFIPFELYPIGIMSEFSGYICISSQGKFFLNCGELYFLGANLKEFVETVIFKEKSWVLIDNKNLIEIFKNI